MVNEARKIETKMPTSPHIRACPALQGLTPRSLKCMLDFELYSTDRQVVQNDREGIVYRMRMRFNLPEKDVKALLIWAGIPF